MLDLPPWAQTLATALSGGAFALAVQWLTQRWAHASAARLAERAEKFEKAKVQKQLAIDLLTRIERICSEVDSRHARGYPPMFDIEDPLESERESIAALAVGLTDPAARRHLEEIDVVIWWIRDPAWREHATALPLKRSAREVLGAIQRGDSLPESLPLLQPSLVAAAKWDRKRGDEIIMEEKLRVRQAERSRAPGESS